MSIDLNELKRIARRATPGPWEWEPPSGEDWPEDDESLVTTWSEDDGCPKSVVSGWGYDASGTNAEPQDRAFIATFNPEAVLALLDRLERAESAIERARALCSEVFSDILSDDFDVTDWQRYESSFPVELLAALGTEGE